MVGASGAGFGKVSVDAKAAASKAAATNSKKAGSASGGAKKNGSGAAAKKLAGGGGGSSKKGGGGGLISAAKKEAEVDEAKSAEAAEAAAEAAAKTAEEEAAAKAAEEAAAAAKAAEDAAAAEKAAAEKAKINGECVVRYNHYNSAFPVVDGVLNWEHVDDKYAISFVFKGNWTCHLIEWVGGAKGTPAGEALLPDTGALHIEMRKDPDGFDPDEEEEKWCGTFSGLSVVDAEGTPREYRLEVQEDAVWEAAQGPKTTYKAADTSNPTGPKMESCSCIEGNPCADAYCCKDCASGEARTRSHPSLLPALQGWHCRVWHCRPPRTREPISKGGAASSGTRCLDATAAYSCHCRGISMLRGAAGIDCSHSRREEPIRGGQEEWLERVLARSPSSSLSALAAAGGMHIVKHIFLRSSSCMARCGFAVAGPEGPAPQRVTLSTVDSGFQDFNLSIRCQTHQSNNHTFWHPGCYTRVLGRSAPSASLTPSALDLPSRVYKVGVGPKWRSRGIASRRAAEGTGGRGVLSRVAWHRASAMEATVCT